MKLVIFCLLPNQIECRPELIHRLDDDKALGSGNYLAIYRINIVFNLLSLDLPNRG